MLNKANALRLDTLAKDTVIAVVTARETGRCDDAEMLLSSYLTEAIELGLCPASAWSMLYSAASLWVSALIDFYARDHDQTPQETIQMFAAANAAGEPGQ